MVIRFGKVTVRLSGLLAISWSLHGDTSNYIILPSHANRGGHETHYIWLGGSCSINEYRTIVPFLCFQLLMDEKK